MWQQAGCCTSVCQEVQDGDEDDPLLLLFFLLLMTMVLLLLSRRPPVLREEKLLLLLLPVLGGADNGGGGVEACVCGVLMMVKDEMEEDEGFPSFLDTSSFYSLCGWLVVGDTHKKLARTCVDVEIISETMLVLLCIY